MTTPASAYSEEPYPGQRPTTSYVQLGKDVHVVDVSKGEGPWRMAATEEPLDSWLQSQGASSMAARTPLLSYGSNACPSKLIRLRTENQLSGPVVMTRCTITGAGAAWCAGTRQADGSVPATLMPAPVIEQDFLWWVDVTQWDALDACEGSHSSRPGWYDLVILDPAICQVHDEIDTEVRKVHAYVGATQTRLPMLGGDGLSVLVTDLSQSDARELLLTVGRRRRLAPPASLGDRVLARPSAGPAAGLPW